jgi:hypothetical protein
MTNKNTEKVIVVSDKMSLKGWNFGRWLFGNWKGIKEVLKMAIPAAVGWASTNNPALTGVITLAGKFLLDMGEYYYKQYTQKA